MNNIAITTTARLVYRKAKQVSSVTYNLFTTAKKFDSETPVAGMSAPVVVRDEVRNEVRNELIKHFPTMESLFGSMDFCECEHCRSVLSPAAYLVDLLQFIDVEQEVWANFNSDWKVKHKEEEYQKDWNKKPDGTDRIVDERKPYDALIERRPDIPYIALTCENTNTAFPYIDIVNEILEYYVANDQLAEDAAHDTGDATTHELLAEPQNVISAAYDKVREARYPLNLPFDLWIETVRQFCNYFETPLARVLEVFRPSDDLFAPGQDFDRSSIFFESLGLSSAELAIFIDANPLDKWYELYGFENAAKATIDLNSAKALSWRLGVSYNEIVEVVQTGFVNPKLTELVLLYKLGVSIHDARLYKDHKPFYVQYKDLIGKVRSTLSTSDQLRFDELTKKVPNSQNTGWEIVNELGAFEQQLTDFAAAYSKPMVDLETYVENIPYSEILVLADPDAGCNFDLTTLQYADGKPVDPIALLRINLFVRLWRKLGWNIEETDRALPTFIPESAPFDGTAANLAKQPLKTALIYIAHLKALDEKLPTGKQSRIKLLTLWSDIATTGKKPLYAQLFLTRSVLKSSKEFDNPLGQYLTDLTIKIKEHVLAIQGALGLTADDIGRILMDDGKNIDTAELSLPNVSLLYRYNLLAKALKLSVRDLISLKQLSGLNPFTPLHPDPLEDTQAGVVPPKKAIAFDHPFSQALRFVEVAEEVKNSGLKIEDLEYLLRHHFDDNGKYRPNHEGTLVLLKKLADGVSSLRAEHAVPDDPGSITEELLRQKLGLALSPDVVERFLAMLNGTVEFTATMTGLNLADELKMSIFSDEERIRQLSYKEVPYKEQKLTFQGVLFDAQKTVLQAKFAPALSAPQKLAFAELLGSVMTLAREFFDNQLMKQKLRLDGEAGFLEDNDFSLLFLPLKQLKKILPTDTPQEVNDKQIANGAIQSKNLTELQSRRYRIAQAFLPFLQIRLIRQFIIQTMTAYAGADPVLVESLTTDERLLKSADSTPLLEAFADACERGITATYFFSGDQSGISLTTQLQADDSFNQVGTVSDPIRSTDANRTVLDGYLEVPRDDAYVFSVLLAMKDDKAELWLGDQLNSLIQKVATQDREEFSTAQVNLDKGKRYRIKLIVEGNGARRVELMAKSTNLPKATYSSARLEGYLEVPNPGAYRFYVVLDKQNAEVELSFSEISKPMPKRIATRDGDELGGGADDFVELKPGIPYRYALNLRKLNGGEARLLVQGEILPKAPISQLILYPLSTMDGAELAVTLLIKVMQLVQSLGLSEREIRYLLTHAADFAGVNLSELPTDAVGDTPAEKAATNQRFRRFLRLASYARLKRDLASGTDDLIGIFEANASTAADKLDTKVYPLIAKLTRRDEATIKATAEALDAAPAFASEKPLQRLWEALQVVERFGVPVSSLLDWTKIVSIGGATPQERFDIARDLKEAIKARFEPEAWQRVAQPIFDKLRQGQRDALVSHVMHQRGFDRMEQLYEYFLIDPGMEPVVQTSRIRLAIASLQLFIQRCLLNLELKVNPSVINSKQWEWMKRYRVWEANRKIFLFPENWLEPEFRDDKTHLFEELEGALLQGDVSSDRVEDAFLNYLKKLDELARLDIVAMHIEDNSDPARRVLHVIGRTYSQPHKYYYRRYAHQMWTNWEPVAAEIEGDHLVPVIWRERLYLFWVTFMEKADPTPSATGSKKLIDATLSSLVTDLNSVVARRQIDVQLHWSEYLQGDWTTRESGGFSTIPTSVNNPFKPIDVFVHVSKYYEGGEERGVYIHLGGTINLAFYLAGRNSAPEQRSYIENSPFGAKPENPYSAETIRANRYSGSDKLTVTFLQRIRNGRVANQIPLYCLYNDKTHDHFYTTSSDERNRCINSGDYVSDGIACYVLPIGDKAGIPLYRFKSAKSGDYFYTTSKENSFIQEAHYELECTACHVLPIGDADGVPLFCWRRKSKDKAYLHVLSTSDEKYTDYEKGSFEKIEMNCLAVLHEEHPETLDILQRKTAYTLLPCDNNLTALGVSEEAYQNATYKAEVHAALELGIGQIGSLMKPVFYQDNAHTFFIEPDVTERTIEERQGWVTTTTRTEAGLKEGRREKISVTPMIPRTLPIPDPAGPRVDVNISPEATINPVLDSDWLVNMGTVLELDGALIGPSGHSGLGTNDASRGMTIDRTPVNISSASGLAVGSTVVVGANSALNQAVLTQGARGLNVVGRGGVNSALAQNFSAMNR